MIARRGARGSVGAACEVPIDPPLLPGEVEIDVSDLAPSATSGIPAILPAMSMHQGLRAGITEEDPVSGPDVNTMTTCRGDLQSAESRIRIEQMIAAARARRRGRDDG